MILESMRGGFTVSCSQTCGEGLVLGSATFDDARAGAIAAGWSEDHRKGGARKSEWTCPSCHARRRAGSDRALGPAFWDGSIHRR